MKLNSGQRQVVCCVVIIVCLGVLVARLDSHVTTSPVDILIFFLGFFAVILLIRDGWQNLKDKLGM
jgi:F0F1-type ATP synthase assembly protein I